MFAFSPNPIITPSAKLPLISESGLNSAYHECTPNDWTVGKGFHAFENPAAAAFTKDNPVFVIIELSNSVDNAAGLAAYIAENIRFE